jgi:hypothetical protein
MVPDFLAQYSSLECCRYWIYSIVELYMRLYRREHGGAHGPWAQPGLPTDHNRSVKTIRKPTLSLLKIESYQITVNPANLLG